MNSEVEFEFIKLDQARNQVKFETETTEFYLDGKHELNGNKGKINLSQIQEDCFECGRVSVSLSNEDEIIFTCIFCDSSCTVLTDFIAHVHNNHLKITEEDDGDEPLRESTLKYCVDNNNHDQQEEHNSLKTEEANFTKDYDGNKNCDGKIKLEIEVLNSSNDKKKTIKSTVCHFCNKNFKFNYQRIRHERTHTGEKQFACEICNKQFYYKNLLDRHLKIHEKNKVKSPINANRAQCDDDAHTSDKNESPSEQVILNEPTNRASTICRYCNKQCKYNYLRIRHERIHTGEKPFTCEICNRQFRYKLLLSQHMRSHEVQSKCPEKKIKAQHNINNENESESLLDKGILSQTTHKASTVCRYCKKRFRFNYLRIRHERTHTGEKPYKCDTCGRSFRTTHLLRLHILTHTGERRHKCPYCNAAFTHQINLTSHIRSIHTFEKRFECEYCGKRFVRNVELRIHERTHTGEKPYQCHECGACFLRCNLLNEHKKRHTNTRPFECSICNLRFYNKVTLKNHSTVHTQEKPFACDVCDAKFSRKTALNVHKKIHSKAREYVCNICGKQFKQSPGLYSHMKTHGQKLTEQKH